MHTMLVLDLLKRTRGRAADLTQAWMETLEFLNPRVGDEVHLFGITAAENVADKMAVRRVTEFGALLELGGREAMEVEALGELDGIRGRLETLHNDYTLEVATAGATGDLGEQLKRALGSPEIR
jgi:hypothetical protein